MKKITLVALLSVTTIGTLNSCTGYKSLSSASTVGQLAGNPFVQQIAKNVINDLAANMVQNGVQKLTQKIGLNTSLSSILTTASALSNFKDLLSSKYGVASSLVDAASNNNSLNTVKDVVSLVAEKGTNIKF